MSESVPATPAPCMRSTSCRSECRACSVCCDRVVYPSACLERGCPNLYAYSSWDGHNYVGCLRQVFAAEIDLDLLRAATAAGGFGALRCTGQPLTVCTVGVERAYPHRADVLGCLDPEFFEPTYGETIRVVSGARTA